MIPSGGRTGLSGSATAENKEVIVSFEKMNRVIEFNEFEETVTVESGVITQEVQKIATEKDLFSPYLLPPKVLLKLEEMWPQMSEEFMSFIMV